LVIPKQYRVEVVFDKPSTSALSSLLAQPYIELNRQTVLEQFLINLKSRDLIQKTLNENGLLESNKGEPLGLDQQVTTIRNLSINLRIAPAKFDFLTEITDEPEAINQISFSLLSEDTKSAQTILNSLLLLATEKTKNDILSDIKGAKAVQERKLLGQLEDIKNAAIADQKVKIVELESAIAIAESLDILNPTSTELTDLYQKGSRVLTAELVQLKKAQPKLGSMIVGYDSEGRAQQISAEAIQGKLDSSLNYSINTDAIKFIADGSQAQIPADAEKPNRKLIAIAATVLAGFFGLFIAIVRIAIKKYN
jgi:LPS O-antigen subunit length determinant protein (WzzB/FepE family)